MAVLGAQLVLSLVMASVIQKLGPHVSFAKWLLCSTGLQHFLHPTDEELRNKAGIPRNAKNGNKKKNVEHNQNNAGQFSIPRSIDVSLQKAPVLEIEVTQMRYFSEYKWFLDFSLYASLVYVFSEIFYFYFPLNNEVNLSMLWCLVVVYFAIKLLSSLTVLYFQTDESLGERSMVAVACLFYLLVAMMVIIVDESILETGLDNSYASFNKSATKFLTDQGLATSKPISKLIVKLILAISCGILGSLLTFPGIRMAKMHWDALKNCQDNKLLQLALNLSFLLPFVLVVFWIRPISRDYLTVRVFEGMEQPLLKPHTFETMRLLLVVAIVAMRLALMPVYLQAYLNLPQEKVQLIRQEAGRISNIELQKKVSSIYYYLCVVTLQFVTPLVLCLFLTFMYKSLGGYSWAAGITAAQTDGNTVIADTNSFTIADSIAQDDISLSFAEDITNSVDGQAQNLQILDAAQSLHDSINYIKNVFTTEVYRGFVGFITWWSYFTLFATSFLGLLYQSYFNKT